MHHGREEELVLKQLGQPQATLIQLILPRVLIGDAGHRQSHAHDGRRYPPGKATGGDPHLADVLDARFHQGFILEGRRRK